MALVDAPAESLTHEEALRVVSKLRRENARLRIHVRDLEAACRAEPAALIAGLRRLRGTLRHLQLQATEQMDMLCEMDLSDDEDE